jgi:signal peptidase
LKKGAIKSVFSKILNVVFVLFFLIGVAVIIIAATSRGSVPSIAGVSFLRVSTGSMAPHYSIGDIILVKDVDAHSLAVGDVISFYSEDPDIKGVANTHRIAEIIVEKDGTRSFITKGDANSDKDIYRAHEDKIIGKAVRRIPGLNRVIDFFQNDTRFFIFILVPVIVIAAFEVRNFMRIVNEKDEAVNDRKEGSQQGSDEKAETKE